MGATRLCVTVTGRTMAELRKRRDEVTDADLVELRVDTVADPDAAAALADRRTPVIFTCRPTWEGGSFAGSEEERHRLLRDAQQLGAEYVDVEWTANFADLLRHRRGRGVVVSMHEFGKVPADLADRARAMHQSGAEVIKLAVMAEQLRDCLTLLPIAHAAPGPTVLIAMGDAGIASRVLAARFQSSWTYAGDQVAPGQLSATRMLREFAFRTISSRTAVYGVVGRPIMHSLSPAMHNAAFRAADIDAVYLPLAAGDFDDFLQFAEALGVAGASVSAPFKLDACARASQCDPIGRRIHAANTLRWSGSSWHACNTDVAGFLAPLMVRGINLQGARATILGAGGAARAAIEALSSAGACVSIAARRSERARNLATITQCAVTDWPPPSGTWDLLVNTTPVGTAPAVHETPLPEGPFHGSVVYDLVYNPLETRLLRDARQAGCTTVGGLEMLVAQATHQFRWWTGASPPTTVMRDAALNALGTSGTIGTMQ